MCRILRPASRDQIRDRAVRQRPSIKSSEAPQGCQQRPTRATGFLPTSDPSTMSGRLGHQWFHWNRARTWAKPIPGSLQINLLFTIFAKQAQNQKWSVQTLFLQKDISHARHHLPFGRVGGAERDRTADPLLAKQVLSQLSYSPNHRNTRQNKPPGSGKPGLHPQKQMVGPGRLELPTPRLSSVCSNQLSYGPISLNLKACNQAPIQDDSPSPVVRRPRGAPACQGHAVRRVSAVKRFYPS